MGGLKKQAFISHSLQAGTYKIKVAANTFPNGRSHPGLQIATFSLRPHREERESSALSPLLKDTNPVTGAPFS